MINLVAMLVVIAAARASTTRESLGWLTIAIAAVLVVNGLLHLLGSLVTGAYSPGLITSVVLYFPLGQLVLMRAWGQARPVFWRGVLTAVAGHTIVSFIALTIAAPS